MKTSERKSCYNLQKFNRAYTVFCAYTVNKTLMGHFHAWPCPEILRCGSVSMFFAQICAQTSDRLEFWVVDLPVHKQRQNDRFINKQKVLSHVLLHLPGTTATGRRWTNASILRRDASREIPDWYEKVITQQHSCIDEDLASFLGIKAKDSNNLWVIPTNINNTRRKHTNESGRKLWTSLTSLSFKHQNKQWDCASCLFCHLSFQSSTFC